MMYKKWICSLLILVATLSPALAAAPRSTRINKNRAQLAVAAANERAQVEAFRLLIFSTVLSTKLPHLVEVPIGVQRKYNNIRNGVFASLPMLATTIGVGFSARGSVEEFKSVLEPVTAILVAIAQSIAESGRMVWKSLEAIGIDRLLAASWDSLVGLAKIFQSFFTAGGAISSLTVLGSGTLGASSYMVWNPTTEDALGTEKVRALLGYNEELQSKLEKVTGELGNAFDLNVVQQATFREAATEELAAQAVANKFSRDAKYSIDVLKILREKSLVSRGTLDAVEVYKELYERSIFDSDSFNDVEILVRNVDSIAALSAVLESLLNEGRLSREDEKEVRQQLADATRNLARVKKYLDAAVE